MRFRAEVETNGRTATGIRVPPEVVAGLDAGKRVAVTVTINGYTYRTTVAPYTGAFLIPLSAENRQGAGVQAGEVVDVDIERDTAPRDVTVPADLAEALDAAGVRAAFDALSFTRRKEYVVAVEGAKKPETRRARIERAVAELAAG
jgi:predicted RNA-binding protein with TRAM domain